MLLCGMTVISLLTAVFSCIGSGVGVHWLWVAPASFVGSFLGLVIAAFLFLLIVTMCVDM